MKNQNNVGEAQGVKATKRNASPAGTIKGLKTNIGNAIELRLVNQEDAKKLKELFEKIVKQYMGDVLL